MDSVEIIKLRDMHGTTDNIKIFGDNAMYFCDWVQHNHIIWDDVNSFVHAIRPNITQYNQDTHQLELVSFPYSNIQYFISIAKIEQLPEILNQMKVNGASITDDKILEIMKELAPLKRNSTVNPYGYISQADNQKL